jgi:PhzF family phenazine biosynthesis protein
MLRVYYIDAFAESLFEGNPAAVIPLRKWLPDDVMQSVAAENNLSETAFFVDSDGEFSIRWFTPVAEVNLCGHATLASAYVLFNELGYEQDTVCFESLSGRLCVSRDGKGIVLDFPSQPPEKCEAPNGLLDGLGVDPVGILSSEDYLVVLRNENAVECLDPLFDVLKKVPLRGIIVTARSKEFDFVTRFFAPKLGVNEDPVTGSAFTQLAPYWAKSLGKSKFVAKQISVRGGKVACEVVGERVLIFGTAVKYMEGEISIDEQR